MTWWDYVGRIANGATQDKIARLVDVTGPTIGRWKTSAPRPENVAAFARAYGRPVLEAFIAAGFLTEEDAATQVTITRQQDPSDEELLDLLRRRLERDRQESGSRGDTAPIGVTEAGGEVLVQDSELPREAPTSRTPGMQEGDRPG